jgi:tetratricopeptide (TPR) repeat protein
MKWKRPVFALITVVAFFCLVEVALWALGVRSLLVERDPFSGFSEQVSVFELDAEAGLWRTSSRARWRSFNDQSFLADKPENGLRVFSLGGSSTYGFPWGAEEAFPQFLGQALASSFPDRHIESINVGAMSYGSHRLRILAHELLRYEPDVFVIYSGHNEFIERSFYSKMLERPEQLDRMRLLLSHSRLFSAVTRLYENIIQPTAESADLDEPLDTGTLLGLDVRREQPHNLVENERADVNRHFGENIGAIIDLCEREGVGVVLSTMPSNISGWRPNRSAFPDGLTPPEKRHIEDTIDSADSALKDENAAEALTLLDGVADAAGRYALWWYLRGNALQRLGSTDDARTAYIRARDLDSSPSRTTTSLNAVIRSLAVERQVALVDAVQVIEQFAPQGLPGFNLFEDYVHPKPVAHELIAEALWQELLRSGLVGAPAEADPAIFWSALGKQRPDAATLSDQPEASTGEQSAPMLFNLAVVLQNQGLNAQAMEKYRACLKLHPGYFYARANLARLLYLEGRYPEAEDEYRQVVAAEPDHLRAVYGLGETLRRLGRVEEALELYERATQIDSQAVSAWNLRGLILIQLDRFSDAEPVFRRAVALDESDANLRALLGGVLLRLDRLDDADDQFESALSLDSGSLKARNGLAAVLARKGEYAAAERRYRESLSLDPENSQALKGLDAVRRLRGD